MHFIPEAKTSTIKPNDDSAFLTPVHDRKTNPIRKIESRQGGKGQGSISDWDPSSDLKFRIPSEPESLSAKFFPHNQNPFTSKSG